MVWILDRPCLCVGCGIFKILDLAQLFEYLHIHFQLHMALGKYNAVMFLTFRVLGLSKGYPWNCLEGSVNF